MEDLGCAVVCARNCDNARMEDLGCAVVSARNCGYAQMERFRMRSDMAQKIVVMRQWMI